MTGPRRGPDARPRRRDGAGSSAAARGAAVILAVIAAGAVPRTPGAAARTTLFATHYVSSNRVQGLAEWGGALVLATDGGVVLHDPATGEFRKLLRPTTDLPSNQILCVAPSPAGLLWAGTADRGVGRLRPDGTALRALTSFDGLPGDRVQALYVRGDSIWVGTAAGVALFTEDPASRRATLRRADTVASTGGALAGDDVRCFLQVGDTLWCGTTAGASSFAGGTWQNRVGALAAGALALGWYADTLWAATSAGPQRYEGGLFTPVAGGHPDASQSLHAGSNALYSGSASTGVYRYQGAGWSAVGDGLPPVPVPAVLERADGSLWAATHAALARFADPAWGLLPSDGPLVNRTHRAVVGPHGAWFSTDGALLADGSRGSVLHFDGARWSALTAAGTGGRLQASDVFGILSDRGGRLWLGHCCSPSDPRPRAERFDPADSAWALPAATNLIGFAESPAGRIYGAGVELENGVYVFDRASGALLDSLTPFNTQGGTGPGLASNNLRGAAFDAAGKGWFIHAARGLDIWDGRGTDTHADDIWTHVESGLPSSQARALVVLGPALAWVGTTAGAARVEGSTVTRALTSTTVPALPSAQVSDLAADPQGNVWIATTGGLARVDADDGGVEIFTSADGILDDDIRSLAWDDAERALWVGTERGISRVYPSEAGSAGFSEATYVFPNPLRGAAARLRLGGITNVVEGEIRDLAGALLRRFRCDPADDEIWDLRRPDGSRASPGVYLVVLRDRGASRILRAAVIR